MKETVSFPDLSLLLLKINGWVGPLQDYNSWILNATVQYCMQTTFTFVQGNLPSGTGTVLSWSFILDSRFAYGNKNKNNLRQDH